MTVGKRPGDRSLFVHWMLTALLFGSFAIGCSARDAEDIRQLTIPHVPASAIHVTAKNGSIQLEQADVTQVEIQAVLRLKSAARLQQAQIIAERKADQSLSVSVEWPDNRYRSGDAASFTIRLPDTAGAYLQSSNGQVSIRDLGGDGELTTSNGSIVVESHHGALLLNTTNGQVRVSTVTGTVDARTTNGKIEILAAGQAVKAKTTNGGINISQTEGNRASVSAATVNGSITLRSGANLSGELILSTTNGEISFAEPPVAKILRMEKAHVHLAFDEEPQVYRLQTTNGRIRIE